MTKYYVLHINNNVWDHNINIFSWKWSGSRADPTSSSLFVPRREESFLAPLSSNWPGSEVAPSMPLPDWLVCVKDDPDWGELLLETLALLLSFRSVPKRESLRVHCESSGKYHTVSLYGHTNIISSYLACWQMLLEAQLYCPAHSPPLQPTQVAG